MSDSKCLTITVDSKLFSATILIVIDIYYSIIVSFGHRYLERYLAALQKPVLYGITGSTSQLFYRTMVMCSSHTDLRDEIQK